MIVKVLKFLMLCDCCSYSALTSLYFVLLDELTITVFQCILYIFPYNWIYPSISMRFLICRALIWPDACFPEPWCYDSLQSSFSTWSCTCKSTATGTTSSGPRLCRSAGTAREFRWVWCDWVWFDVTGCVVCTVIVFSGNVWTYTFWALCTDKFDRAKHPASDYLLWLERPIFLRMRGLVHWNAIPWNPGDVQEPGDRLFHKAYVAGFSSQ